MFEICAECFALSPLRVRCCATASAVSGPLCQLKSENYLRWHRKEIYFLYVISSAKSKMNYSDGWGHSSDKQRRRLGDDGGFDALRPRHKAKNEIDAIECSPPMGQMTERSLESE